MNKGKENPNMALEHNWWSTHPARFFSLRIQTHAVKVVDWAVIVFPDTIFTGNNRILAENHLINKEKNHG